MLTVHEHLAGFRGVLQVDAYAGYSRLTKPDRPGGPITLAFCLAHARRKFWEIYKASGSAGAKEALRQIQAVYAVEERIRGLTAAERAAVRQAETKSLLAAFKIWLLQCLAEESKKSSLAKAIRYSLGHWQGLTLFLTDGRIEVDSNVVERTIRPIATPKSLCTSSSSIWKHWELVFGGEMTRAPFTPGRLHHGWRVKVRGEDLERRAANDLLSAKDARFDELADPVAGNAASLGRLAQGQPGSVLLGGLIGVNVADASDRADPMGRPGLALAGRQAHPIERGGDVLVGPAGCHAANDRQGLVGGAAAVFAGAQVYAGEVRSAVRPSNG